MTPANSFWFRLLAAVFLVFITITSSVAIENDGDFDQDFANIVPIYETYLKERGKDMNRLRTVERLQAFRDCFGYVSSHNAKKMSFTLELNDMCDWTADERKRRFKPLPKIDSDPSFRLPSSSSALPLRTTSGSSYPSTLNWATEQNPLGYQVTSPILNQEECGGCWAFATAEVVEASVNINSNLTYQSGQQTVLSVQQLLDCDANKVNDGCNGGNPISSYPYIMKNGITAASDFPFVDKNTKCPSPMSGPVAGIKNYAVLKENDQSVMMEFIQSGPIAIGLCASQNEFAYYSSGVIDFQCCKTLDHAVVAVGYGTDSSTGLDYWIVQNSWGVSWGSDGFVLLLRTMDQNSPGMCGLAMSTSQPIGGYVIPAGGSPSPSGSGGNNGNAWDTFVRWLKSNWKEILWCFSGMLILTAISCFTYAAVLDWGLSCLCLCCISPCASSNPNSRYRSITESDDRDFECITCGESPNPYQSRSYGYGNGYGNSYTYGSQSYNVQGQGQGQSYNTANPNPNPNLTANPPELPGFYRNLNLSGSGNSISLDSGRGSANALPLNNDDTVINNNIRSSSSSSSRGVTEKDSIALGKVQPIVSSSGLGLDDQLNNLPVALPLSVPTAVQTHTLAQTHPQNLASVRYPLSKPLQPVLPLQPAPIDVGGFVRGSSGSVQLESSEDLSASAPASLTHLSQADSSPTWSCEACTFNNHSALTKCEICGRGRQTDV